MPVLPRLILKTNGTGQLNSLGPPVIKRLLTRQRSQANESCEGGDVSEEDASNKSCEKHVREHEDESMQIIEHHAETVGPRDEQAEVDGGGDDDAASVSEEGQIGGL